MPGVETSGVVFRARRHLLGFVTQAQLTRSLKLTLAGNLQRNHDALHALDLQTVHSISQFAHSPNERAALQDLHRQLVPLTEEVGRLQSEVQMFANLLGRSGFCDGSCR